ncbi:hypothetical protein MTR67_048521 [Solanum verrucosum]|uniref:Uncharacterized protein n=1 Tax=Solanum verrucosum TaxID=315347 RepID=A0AAF0V1S0_SOLVR|nr:hypothetical protein MTR67_048521 [Solanum verrucosum]
MSLILLISRRPSRVSTKICTRRQKFGGQNYNYSRFLVLMRMKRKSYINKLRRIF